MVEKNREKKYVSLYKKANDVVDNERICPDLGEEGIIDLISENDWMPIVSPDISGGKDSVSSSKYPNIFVGLREDSKIRMGIVFNTIKSIERIKKSILSKFSREGRENLVRKLSKLGDGYETEVSRKIRKTFQSTPEYVGPDKDPELFHRQTNEIDLSSIEDMFECVQKVRKEGKEERKRLLEQEEVSKSYTNTPHINLATIITDESNFAEELNKLIEPYEVFLEMKSDSEVREMRKEEKKEIENLIEEKKNLKERIEEIGDFQPGFVEKAQERIKKIVERLEELGNYEEY